MKWRIKEKSTLQLLNIQALNVSQTNEYQYNIFQNSYVIQ